MYGGERPVGGRLRVATTDGGRHDWLLGPKAGEARRVVLLMEEAAAPG